jgi:hypothetical protein
MKKIIFALILFGSCSLFAAAQTAGGEEDFQSWNDLQLTVPMTGHFDFFTQVAMRFGDNVKRLSDGRFTLGFVWKPNKAWSFSPFYQHVRARNAAGRFRTEHRLNLRAQYRFPFKKFGLSHRSTYEYRLRQPLNSWRYRPSLTFEKDIPKKFIPAAKFYITEEIFYDSLLKKFSRNRFTAGITKTLTKKLSLDVYYMRQNDGFSRPGDLNVIGTSWKVRL